MQLQGYYLLNCDDHGNFLRRHDKDPALYRPDICHQALLAILDSPLAKSGRLKVLLLFTSTRSCVSSVLPSGVIINLERLGL